MGSQLSQSQQLRNTFPLSEYKLLPTDKNFPDLTFLQKLSDVSVYAVKITDKHKESYEPSNSKHLIKRVQKKEINKKIFELYDWANANVQGLVEYINLVDKNRKISKSEFNAIVEGAIRGYSAVSKQCFEIECLEISMKKLRIFNEISLKDGSFNSKEVINSILVKLIPKSLNECLQKDESSQKLWAHVGSCIHQGGILTEKQLLGEYLLQLSNYATKQDFKNKLESLKNLKVSFGTKSFKTVEALLANEDWKNVIKILETNFTEESAPPLKQIQNYTRTNKTIEEQKEKQHETQTQKTIDTDKNKSEKVLFQCFKNEQKCKSNITRVQSPPKQARVKSPPKEFQTQTYLNVPNSPNDRSRINSTQYYRSLSPVRTEKFISPTSVKIIREVSPPPVTKVYERTDDYSNMDNLKLTRTNSILTILPEAYRNQNITRNRMLSTRNLPTQILSPQRKTQTQYLNSPVNSPRMNNSPKYEKQNDVSQQKINQVQKRKGKKIDLRPSKQNPTLRQIQIPEYQWKIKVDKVQGSKKQNENETDQRNRNESFLSQEFSSLKFQLGQKYFASNENKTSKPTFFSVEPEKSALQKSPKVEIKNNLKPAQNTSIVKETNNLAQNFTTNQNPSKKTQSQKILHYPPRQNSQLSMNVKQVNSETFLMDPDSNVISFRRVDKVDKVNKANKVDVSPVSLASPVKVEAKESKYVGSLNMKGQKEGQGKIYFPSGGYYVGSFYKDFMHGHGKLYYPCGKLAYEGTFSYDKFHGSGKLYNQNPTFISSFDFRNFNKLELTEKQQPVHKEHHLISPVQKEKKISYWKFYEGEMNYDMKHGKGVLVLENGEKYEGEFRDDLVHGKGVFYGQNGKISGRWEDNLLIEVYR